MPNDYNWIFSTDWIAAIKGLIALMCLFALMIVAYEFFIKILNKIGVTTAKQREHMKNIKDLNNHTKQIEELKKITTTTNDALNKLTPLINSMDKSIKNINNKVDSLNNCIISIDKRVQTIEKKQEADDKRNVESQKARHKDRLYQAYAFYKKRAEQTGKKEWNSVEKDGFDSMVKAYELYDGNSKVHTDVLPYMSEFKVVD